MDELHDLIKDFMAPDKRSSFSVFLRGVDNFKTFANGDSAGLQPILKYIRLNTSDPIRTDIQPLLVMKLFVTQCSSQVFAENCANWTLHLTNLVRLSQEASIVSLAAEILTDMLPFIVQNADHNRLFASSSLATLVTALVEKKTVPALKCLEQCMVYFRGPCRQQRVEIEKCILSALISTDAEVVKVAGEMLALMAGLGGGGEHGTYHTTAWLDYCHHILVSLHSIMQSLFAKVEANQEIAWKPWRREKLDLPQIEDKRPIIRVQLTTARFEALCHCLVQVISTPFPAVVNIPIGDIIGLICRVAAVKPNSLLLSRKKRTTDDLVFLSLLPGIHCALLNVVHALILTCRKNLVPHSTTLSKVLLQYLQWTKSSRQTQTLSEKPFCDLRIKAYEVLQVWVQIMTTSSTIDKFHSQLAEHLLVDIQNYIEPVKLQVNSNEDKAHERPPKKRKVDFAHTLTSSSSLGICKENSLANSKLCACALRAFKTYVYAMGPLLHVTSYASACRAVVHLIRDIQQQFLQLPSPYEDPLCRRELYSLLLALTVSSPPSAKLPVSIAGLFISRGLKDPDVLVSSFCLEAEAMISALIHPAIPSLELPMCNLPVTKDVDPLAASLHIQQLFWDTEEPSDIPQSPTGRPTDAETTALVDENSNNIDLLDASQQSEEHLETEELDGSCSEMNTSNDKAESTLGQEKEDSLVLESDDDNKKDDEENRKDNDEEGDEDNTEKDKKMVRGTPTEEQSLLSKHDRKTRDKSPEAGPSRIESTVNTTSPAKKVARKDQEDDVAEESLDGMLQSFDDRDSDV